MPKISKKEVIVVFGDSIVEGFLVPKDRCFVSLLQKKLPYKIIKNYGKTGNTTIDALNRIEELLKEKPNNVIISFGINDVQLRLPRIEKLISLYKLNFLKPVRVFLLNYIGKPKLTLSQYKENLHKIISTLKDKGISATLLTTTRVRDDIHPRTNNSLRKCDSIIKELANETGAKVIDISKNFENNLSLLIDPKHPNEEGHRIIAEEIFTELKKYN